MGKKQDPCWRHAKDISSGSQASFQCNYCSNNFAGGVLQIKAHLSGKENSGIRSCPSAPRDVVEIFSKAKRASFEMENENMDPLSLRNTRPRVLEGEKDKRRVDHKLARFITIFNLPSEVVKSHIFTDFVEAVAQYGSDYKLPDSYTLAALGYETKVKRSLVDTGCTLMVDEKGMYTYSLGGLLYQHYEIEESDDKIFSIIDTSVNSIGSTKVLQIFFDAYRSIYSSALEKRLIDRYQCLKVGFSPAFEIGRLLQCIFQLKGMRVISQIARRITTETDNYWFCVRLAEDHMIPCVSEDYEIQCTIDIIDESWRLTKLLKSIDERQKFMFGDFFEGVADENRHHDHIIHGEKFWVKVNEYASVLQALTETLFFVTNKLCPPSGYLYQIMERLRETIGKCLHMDEDDIDILVQKFCEVRRKVMHPMYAAATFLNPAYMYSERFEENGELRHGIDFIQNYLVEEDEKTPFKYELNRYCATNEKIFKGTTKLMLESYHPVKWWKCYGESLPTLQKYAIQILSQPCHALNSCNLQPQGEYDHVSHDFYGSMTKKAVFMKYFGTIEMEKLKAIDFSNVDLPEWLHAHPTTVAFPESKC